jgi:hypothetical protein
VNHDHTVNIFHYSFQCVAAFLGIPERSALQPFTIPDQKSSEMVMKRKWSGTLVAQKYRTLGNVPEQDKRSEIFEKSSSRYVQASKTNETL